MAFCLLMVAFLKSLVSSNGKFHEKHAQHKFMGIVHNLNMSVFWACLVSCSGGFGEVFLRLPKYLNYINAQ